MEMAEMFTLELVWQTIGLCIGLMGSQSQSKKETHHLFKLMLARWANVD